MIVLAAVLGCGFLGAILGALVVGRWPERDPDAPALRSGRVRHTIRSHRHLAAVLRRDIHPAGAMALVLAAALAILVVTMAALGLVLLLATSDDVTGRTDGPLTTWAAEHSSPAATDVIRTLSRLGGTAGVVVLAVAVAVFEWRRIPARGVPVLLTLTVAGQFAIVALIKAGIDRARPELLQLTGFAGASFPSGHATAAAASFACFALLLGRRRSRRARALLAGGAAGVAFTVAATRVALGVHWFTDVVAGVILGWGWFALCSMAVGGHALRFGQPIELAECVARTERPA